MKKGQFVFFFTELQRTIPETDKSRGGVSKEIIEGRHRIEMLHLFGRHTMIL